MRLLMTLVVISFVFTLVLFFGLLFEPLDCDKFVFNDVITSGK